jgi:enoyl-CoA hydratase/carnithine racemase
METITFNRPKVLNALHQRMLEDFLGRRRDFGADRGIGNFDE